MTPAIFALSKLKIPFKTLQYQHDVHCKNFGLEVVDKLNLASELVYKTLIVNVDDCYLAVAIIPVDHTLSFKKVAKTLKAKKVKMAEEQKVKNSTGYILGGVSPFGQKRRLKTLVNCCASQHELIYVSGGKRGLEIEIAPLNLVNTLNADYAEITN